jgi:hypothetical protein
MDLNRFKFIQNVKGKSASIPSGGNSDVSPNDTSGRTVPISINASNSPDYIPHNILAFRTITTLLGKIQQENSPKFADTGTTTEAEKKELRLSTAFANLANTDIEVIAIATSNSVDEIEVIVSTSQDNDGLTKICSPPIKITDLIWRMIFSSNARRDDTTTVTAGHHRDYPLIAQPAIPQSVKDHDLKTLQNYIEKEWCVDFLNFHGICSLLTI